MKTLQTGYISGVDLARIVGAIGIVLFHFGCHSDYLSPFLCGSANDNWGRIWVALFLAISGACLARTYATSFEWKSFFIRRWKSIFPMFFLCYLLFAIIYTLSYGPWWSGVPRYRFIYTLLGLDGFLSFYQPNFYLIGEWFLGVLIVCYLLFPALLWLLKHIPYTTGALLLVGTYFIPFLPCFARDPFQNIWTCVTIFYLGMLIAQSRHLLCNKVAFWISTILLVFLLFTHIPYYEYLRLYGAILTGLLLLISLSNLGRMCEQNEPVKRALSVLGKLSFPIFLVQHIMIVRVQTHWGGDSIATALVGLFMAIGLSILLSWAISVVHERIMSSCDKRKQAH